MRNNLALYELFQASHRAQPKKERLSLSSVRNYFKDLTTKDLTNSSLELSDIPKHIKASTTLSFLDLVTDRLILMNHGFPKKQNLGLQYYECHKLLLVSEILNTLLFKRAALFSAEHALKKAKKYNFLNIMFQSCRIIYSTKVWMNDVKGTIEASNEFRKYLKYYDIEKGMEIEYNTAFMYYNKTNSSSGSILEICNNAIEKYEQYENKIPSHFFHTHYYHILYLKYLNEKKHDKVYETAVKALDWFDDLNFEYIPGKLAFIFIQIVYTIQKREFEEGKILLKKALTYISNKSQYWFRIKENELLLHFHMGDYGTAVQIFFEVINNKSFVSVTPYDRQRWLLYEAYTNLIMEANTVQYEHRRKRFSIQKFINELPIFSKDKRSMNIPILIAQMLFFIVRRQYNHAIDRIEALDKYSSRYLRNDDTFRSNCFIKMLLEIPKNSFNRLRVERSAHKYFQRLLDSEIDLIDQPFEIEIIPYERLWAMIMNHLRPDHHYTPKTPRAPMVS